MIALDPYGIRVGLIAPSGGNILTERSKSCHCRISANFIEKQRVNERRIKEDLWKYGICDLLYNSSAMKG